MITSLEKIGGKAAYHSPLRNATKVGTFFYLITVLLWQSRFEMYRQLRFGQNCSLLESYKSCESKILYFWSIAVWVSLGSTMLECHRWDLLKFSRWDTYKPCKIQFKPNEIILNSSIKQLPKRKIHQVFLFLWPLNLINSLNIANQTLFLSMILSSPTSIVENTYL